MKKQAKGPFEVKATHQPPYASIDNATLARSSYTKEFRGDLEATSSLEMLSAMGGVKGSAGYVAIELVDGTLHGKRGSFVLQHSGRMHRGQASLTVTVVSDSGSGELKGLSGTFAIDMANGAHSYTFDYELDPD